MSDYIPFSQFFREAGISMTAERWHENPYGEMNDRHMDHWRVKLTRAGDRRRQLTTYFSMGSAFDGKPPKACDVLDCLASDASGYESAGDFENWANDYGYDADSRKAERVFRVIARQSVRLRKFLGEQSYERLLWNVTRL